MRFSFHTSENLPTYKFFVFPFFLSISETIRTSSFSPFKQSLNWYMQKAFKMNAPFVINMNTNLRYCICKYNADTRNSLCAALWYLEQLQDILTPRSLKSHVVTPFGTSFLGGASLGWFDLWGTNRSMRARNQLHNCTSTIIMPSKHKEIM